MENIIYYIINMSIIGALMIVIVLLIRKVKFIPKRISYIFWSIPIMRLIFPYSVSAKFSFFNLLGDYKPKSVVIKSFFTELPITPKFSNAMQIASNYEPIRYKSIIYEKMFNSLFYIWSGVALVLIVLLIIFYIITINNYKGSVKRSDYYISDVAECPFICGIFYQKIILPVGISEDKINYILLHEKVHKKRHDNAVRMIILVITCIHWFNPFVWIMLGKVFEDMELSCDELAMRNLDNNEQCNYIETILNSRFNRSIYVSTFGGANKKNRIYNLLNYKKLSVASLGFLITICCCIFLSLLTNN